MPHRTFGIEEVGRYLHLSKADVEMLVRKGDIPHEKRGNRLIFRKVDIDAWASQRILGLEARPLASYHQKTSSAAADLAGELLMPGLLRPAFIHPSLPARTKSSALRELAALAATTGRVADEKALLESIEAREALCSTGLPGGLALPHPRYPDPLVIDSPFIVVGRLIHGIPFGAPDHCPTDLLFLLGCPDDRLHLHTLARICLMAQKTDLLNRIRQADDAAEMEQEILSAEAAVVAG